MSLGALNTTLASHDNTAGEKVKSRKKVKRTRAKEFWKETREQGKVARIKRFWRERRREKKQYRNRRKRGKSEGGLERRRQMEQARNRNKVKRRK